MCVICKQAGRPHQRFLSACMYLPEEGRLYMTKSRQLDGENYDSDMSEELSVAAHPNIEYEYQNAKSTVVWPGNFLEVDIPSNIEPDSFLAVEPRSDCV